MSTEGEIELPKTLLDDIDYGKEFNQLSNLKKDMVRRKIRKLMYRNAYTNANNVRSKKKRRR